MPKPRRILAASSKAEPQRNQNTAQPSRSDHVTVERLASKLGIKVEMIVRVAPSLGIEAKNGKAALTPSDAERLIDFFRRHGSNAPEIQPPPIAVFSSPSEPRVIPKSSLDYDWPGKVGPFAHQVVTTEFLVNNNRAFCLNDMGTGKTLSVLWAYDYLRRAGQVQSMFVVCPLSTMVRTWKDEIETHFRRTRVAVLHGAADERRKLLRSPADIYIINHDGIKITGIVDLLKDRLDIDLLVIDEVAQVGRNAGTDRYRALLALCNRQTPTPRRVWGLTGTPTPNQPTDAWAQCRLIVPDRVHPYFNRFKEQVMRQINQFLWVPRTNALEVVHEAMQPAIRFIREKCIDLPPVLYETREVELTPVQEKAYAQMLTTLQAQVRGKVIDAKTLLVMATKLLQIACGAAYINADGRQETVFIPAKPRLDEMLAVIEEARASVIVFVPFVGVLRAVADYLNSNSITFAEIHGGVPQKKRDEIFSQFQTKKTIPVLLASPTAMSHGLTLTAADTIIWFGPITKNEIVQQANARISRPGQTRNQLIVYLEGSPIEKLIYERLRNKQDFQQALLNLFGAAGVQADPQIAAESLQKQPGE